MTKEQVITRIKNNSMYRDDRETADYIINALEQQLCEDCANRQAVIKAISEDLEIEIMGSKGLALYQNEIADIIKNLIINQEEKVKSLPPVTPAHGTCKDCKHKEKLNENFYCGIIDSIRNDENFYCADFERKEVKPPKI